MKLIPHITVCALLVSATSGAFASPTVSGYLVTVSGGLLLVNSRTEGMEMICGRAGVLGWLCHNAASGPATWYAPICGSNKIKALGRASESAMQGRFTFDPSTTREQREYIEHWRALAAHCMRSPDNSCNENWKPPCSPKCDGAACKPIS